MRFLFIISIFCWSLITSAEVRIGFLANMGKPEIEKLSVGLVHFLEHELGEEVDIVPLGFSEVDTAIANQNIDFIFLNPMMFVEYEYKYEIQNILKVERHYQDHFVGSFGTVIFSRKGVNIDDQQIVSHGIAAVSPHSLGGWLIAKYHLLKHGIDLDKREVTFLYNHDKVVENVLSGKFDVGIVRTGILESLIRQGKITESQFSIRCHHKSSIFKFLSSETYSEWPLAALAHVSEKLRHRVASALLKVSYLSPELSTNLIGKWTLPTSYNKTKSLMKYFGYYPYDVLTRMSFTKVIKHNKKRFAFMMTLLVSFIILSVLFFRKNKYISSLSEELRLEKEELDRFLDLVPIPLVLLDRDNRIHRANKIFYTLSGDSSRGNLLKDYIDGLDCQRFLEAIEHQEVFSVNDKLYLKTENKHQIPISLEVIPQVIKGEKRSVVIIYDLTQENKVLELQRMMAINELENKKIHSVGILGSGIAHEINNPLTVINSSAKILLKYLDKGRFDQKIWKKMLEDTISAGIKISSIIKALRLLGKTEEDSPCELITVGKLVESSLLLVATRFLQNKITFNYDYKFGDKPIYISHAKFHQILMNILVNAEIVVKESEDQRWITIKTELLDEQFVLFKISNSGKRISKRMEEDAFIPFASDTIEVTGKGSSLAAAKQYLKSIKGDIWVNPNSEYTEFIIKVPMDFRNIS